ncbi:MAG: hypothetical protein PVJ57_14880 [Phycisphaerae bacterium]|jgi:hypothetical protein
MSTPEPTSPFVVIPTDFGGLLRLLGPPPAEAAVAVDPLVHLDTPLDVVQSLIGGLCGADGQLNQPAEILLLLDPESGPPEDLIPYAALLARYETMPDVDVQLPVQPAANLLHAAFGTMPAIGPLLYCRKRHRIFAARSPNTGAPLSRVPADAGDDASATGKDGIPREWLVWDGPDQAEPAIYSGRAGSTAAGRAASHEQLILDQGKVVRLATDLATREPAAAQELTAAHVCTTCAERERCFPEGGGYAYAADRLLVVHALPVRPVVRPLGAWRLDETARIIGGVDPRSICAAEGDPENAFTAWRQQQAEQIETAGPRYLLAGEAGGRQLAEVARLKMALFVDVLAQLDAAWRITTRPHLYWRNETIRVAWNSPAQTPATLWGLQPILRHIGRQPDVAVDGADQLLPYPPALSDRTLLPPDVAEALRYFGTPRPVNVFVKTISKTGDAHVLLEELGIPRELFCPADVIQVAGPGWRATLAPTPEQNPDDGEGLGVRGPVQGDTKRLSANTAVEGCECRWYPRFGEAIDLYAVGMLLLETLLTNDEREGQRLREAVLAEREELLTACRGLPVEQRESRAATWIAGRAESDAPGSLWSRRNLLYARADRASVPLDGLPMNLWQAVLSLTLRLITPLEGFGFCPDRAAPAPRTADGHLLPLLELRGWVALWDDLILGRRAPGESLRQALHEADD